MQGRVRAKLLIKYLTMCVQVASHMKSYDAICPPWYTYLFILVNVSLLHILIASDQFVNIVYMLLLYLKYLISVSE